MASIQPYSVRGKRYWRIVESFRDDRSRPRLRVIRHIGTAQKLIELLSDSRGRALCAEEREFGATSALWDMAGRLRLVETIDDHAPKRRQGASVGEYMLLATINRVVDPRSKAGLAEWYRETILPRLLPMPREALCSQRFWDHMHYLDEAALAAVETDLTRRLVEDFGVDVGRCFTTRPTSILSCVRRIRANWRSGAMPSRNERICASLAWR